GSRRPSSRDRRRGCRRCWACLPFPVRTRRRSSPRRSSSERPWRTYATIASCHLSLRPDSHRVAAEPRATSSKLLRHVQSERLAVDPIRRRNLLKGVEVHDESPWHVRESDLTTRRMHLVQHVRRGGIASSVVRYLPGVVARRPDFQQQGLTLIQGHVLADAPGEREVLAGRQVEILLLAVHLVRQRR